jgi:molecular chaperone DnaK
MTYTLGVDLGTTTSAAAVLRDRRLEPCPLGESSLTVPSIVLPRDDGRTLIGEAAALHGGVAPVRLARAGDRGRAAAVGTVDAHGAIDAHDALCMLLDAVIDQVAADHGGRPARLALVQPAAHADGTGGPYSWVAAETPGDPLLVAAPVATATMVDHERGLTPGSTVGVLDLGGDVSEAALVRRTAGGFDVVGRPCTGPGIGGSDIDTIVLRHIDAALDHAVSALDPDADLGALDRLLAGCRRAKEQLLRSEDAVEVGLPRMTARVRVTRAELQRLVRPHLTRAVAALERTIAETGLSADDLEAVVLVGGSARLPAAAELVAERIGRPVVVDAAPEMTAALGAALAVTPAAERPAPAPAPASLVSLGAPFSDGGAPVTYPATPAGGTITLPAALAPATAPVDVPGVADDDMPSGEPARQSRGRWSAHLRRTPAADALTATDAGPDTDRIPEHDEPSADPTPTALGWIGGVRRGDRRSAGQGVGWPRGGRGRGLDAPGTVASATAGGGEAGRSGGGEPERVGRRVLLASAVLLVLMAVAGTLLATGAGNRDGDQRPVDSIQTSEHPGGVVPGLSDPARPTSVGSDSSLDSRSGDATTSSSSPSTSEDNTSAGDRGPDGTTGDGGPDDHGENDGDDDPGDGGWSRDDRGDDRTGRGDDRGDDQDDSDRSDPTNPPTTGRPTVTAPERPDSPPTTAPPAPAPQPQPQPEDNLVDNLFQILLGGD